MGTFGFDIVGQLNTMNLAESKALWPIFETVINSIQAIEDSSNRDDGIITIIAKREASEQETIDTNRLGRFESFTIQDNGVGLDEKNYKSFNTAYSTLKVKKGCKGIGRFLWLKAFESVEIESVYQENGLYYYRAFSFTEKGISPDDNLSQSEKKSTGTIVTLNGFKSPYRESAQTPIELSVMARKIIEHCLQFFISGTCPKIIIKDEDQTIDINAYFKDMVQDSLHQDHFEINNDKYVVFRMLLNKGGDSHKLHLCADGQDVFSVELKKYIPNLQKKIHSTNDDISYYYEGYVASSYLDSIVNSSRTGFEFTEDGRQESFVGADKDSIIMGAVELIQDYLQEYLEDIELEKRKQIDRFVAYDKPTYRFLLNKKPEIYGKIAAGLSSDELDLELHKYVQRYEREIKEQQNEVEKLVMSEINDDDLSYMQLFEIYWERVTELSKVSLAEYVTRRKAILKLLEDALTIQQDGKFKREEVIHSIICPMRHTSDDVSFEEINLWIIDERLAYHTYLASDKTIKSLPGVDSKSTKEVDVAVFDTAFAFSEDDSPLNTITIIEFKKPDNRKDNPLLQMGNYIDEIMAGKKKRASGLSFGDCSNTSFRCYAICDHSDKMESYCKGAGLRKMPDGQGYYGYWPERNAYVEAIFYPKLLGDAKKRNQAFVDKLFEPKTSEIIHLIGDE